MLLMAIASAALGAAAGLRRKKGGRLLPHAVYGQRRQGRRQKGGIIPLLALASPAIAAAAKAAALGAVGTAAGVGVKKALGK